mmetsp:Transcript_1473/g.1583  ORF Transcript_1473/g.1583 Transcript_1473/m.1583 type:complete len:289 (-) Transcript_1473:184-1050(-)
MISLPFMAWIGVVIIQAVIHFVIIRRRRKKLSLILEGESGIINGAVDVVYLSNENTDSSVHIRKYDNDDHVEGQDDDEHEALADTDECDLNDDEQQRIRSLSERLPVLEPRNSRLEALDNGTRVEIEQVSTIHSVDNYLSDAHIHDEDVYPCCSRMASSLLEAQKSYCDDDDINDHDSDCANIGDYDSDCDNIDDDEQWRYELVKQYYAPSAESILTIASRSNLEPDGQRLEPVEIVEDSTRMLNDSLERRQSSLLNSHVNNVDDVDERLTFPSSTSPFYAIPSISCA